MVLQCLPDQCFPFSPTKTTSNSNAAIEEKIQRISNNHCNLSILNRIIFRANSVVMDGLIMERPGQRIRSDTFVIRSDTNDFRVGFRAKFSHLTAY